MNVIRPQIENEADLIVEALVKEIARGCRWSAMVEAWQAILTVRRIAGNLEAERKHLSGAGVAGAAISAHDALQRKHPSDY